MAKVIKLAITTPEKFGPQRVRTRKSSTLEKNGQLNLFSGGKIVKLHQLSVFEEALMFDEQGDVTTSRTLYLEAIKKEDALADAYCNLGILEFKEGNTAQAIDHFTLSLKHDPRHFEAHYNLANAYGEVGNFALAKIHYNVSIQIEPSFPNSYFNLGLTMAMNKEFAQAIAVFNQYRSLTPESEHGQVNDLISKLSEQ